MGLGFRVPVGPDVVFVIAVLVRVLLVFGLVGRGIPKLTSTQYELPIKIPEQSSLIEGFCVDVSVTLQARAEGNLRNQRNCRK